MIDAKWTHDLAYAVGLIATDGHLSKDGRHINLTSKDDEQLLNFMKAVKRTYKISRKKSGYTDTFSGYIQFSDVVFYKWLFELGFLQKKTENLSNLHIPDKYFFDFLRGHFDGDGCIYSYFDARWKNSFMFYLTFIAKNLDHVLWLQHQIERLSGARGKIGYGCRVNQLRFAKRESRIVIAKMYKHSEGLYLNRKYDKILKILSNDKTDADVLELVDWPA